MHSLQTTLVAIFVPTVSCSASPAEMGDKTPAETAADGANTSSEAVPEAGTKGAETAADGANTSSEAVPEAGTKGGEAGDSDTAAEAGRQTSEEGDVHASCILHQAWKATSTRFEIRSFGYFEGSSGYAVDRTAMSGAQLAALDGLCVMPTPSGPTASDYESFAIKITDADESVATYRAAVDDVRDGDEQNPNIATINFTSLQPFLETFHCLSAGQTRVVGAPADAGADGEAGTLPWAAAPTVQAEESGCLNGVFVPYTCADVWLKLNVARAGTYDLRAENCIETTAIQVLSPDGSTELASASGTSPNCASVSYQFDHADTYLIDLRKTNQSGCGAQGSAGDFFLTVTPAATTAADGSTD